MTQPVQTMDISNFLQFTVTFDVFKFKFDQSYWICGFLWPQFTVTVDSSVQRQDVEINE